MSNCGAAQLAALAQLCRHLRHRCRNMDGGSDAVIRGAMLDEHAFVNLRPRLALGNRVDLRNLVPSHNGTPVLWVHRSGPATSVNHVGDLGGLRCTQNTGQEPYDSVPRVLAFAQIPSLIRYPTC